MKLIGNQKRGIQWMTKTFIQVERDKYFWNKVREYKKEGYSFKEAKDLASQDANEAMAPDEILMDHLEREAWE